MRRQSEHDVASVLRTQAFGCHPCLADNCVARLTDAASVAEAEATRRAREGELESTVATLQRDLQQALDNTKAVESAAAEAAAQAQQRQARRWFQWMMHGTSLTLTATILSLFSSQTELTSVQASVQRLTGQLSDSTARVAELEGRLADVEAARAAQLAEHAALREAHQASVQAAAEQRHQVRQHHIRGSPPRAHSSFPELTLCVDDSRSPSWPRWRPSWRRASGNWRSVE